MDSVPLDAFTPSHPPEAEQLVAFVELHVSVDDAPLAMVVGLAVSVTVGAGAIVTVTVWLALPPVPVQDKVKLVVAANAGVDALPFTALVPVQPPDAVQLVEFVEFQVRTDVPPLAIVVGLAVSVTVGAAVIETLAVVLVVPPVPVQANVKFVAVVSAPVD